MTKSFKLSEMIARWPGVRGMGERETTDGGEVGRFYDALRSSGFSSAALAHGEARPRLMLCAFTPASSRATWSNAQSLNQSAGPSAIGRDSNACR